MPLINANCHDCKIRISSQIIAKHFQYLILLEKISRISPSGGTGGSPRPLPHPLPPLTEKLACPSTSPHPIDLPPKSLFSDFHAGFGNFAQIAPSPIHKSVTLIDAYL